MGVLLRERAAHETTGHAGILRRDKTYPVSVCLKDVRFVKGNGISSCNIFMRPEDQHCCSCFTDRSSPTGTAASSYFSQPLLGSVRRTRGALGLLRDAPHPRAAGLDSLGPAHRRQPEQAQCLSPTEPAGNQPGAVPCSVPALFLPPSPLLTGYIMCYHLCLFV